VVAYQLFRGPCCLQVPGGVARMGAVHVITALLLTTTIVYSLLSRNGLPTGAPTPVVSSDSHD
jgi:hypothetical protein